jgi:2-methylisocitrate lyase-like PEP mutase family enzyme
MVSDRAAIGRLVEQAGGPVNVLYRPGDPAAPSIAELAGLGVARISFGPGLYRATYAKLADVLTQIW